MHMPVVQNLVRQLMDTEIARGMKFYLVVVPDDGDPRMEEFEEVSIMQNRITELLEGTEAAIYPFMGHWLWLSEPPYHYMSTPFGMLPLFKVPSPNEVKINRSGWIGKEQQHLPAPAAPPEPANALIPQTGIQVAEEVPMFAGADS
jgi:hypothetical protein